MFSQQIMSDYQSNNYQYWPTWMLYNFQQFNTFSANQNLCNFISSNVTSSNQQLTTFSNQSFPISPKLSFIEQKPRQSSQTTNLAQNSQILREFNSKSNNEQSSFVCKRKKTISKNKKPKRGPQNKNRNIIPSLVQQIFSFISKPTKSKPVCEKIFATLTKPEKYQVTTQRYYYYAKQVKERLNHYVNQKSLNALNQIQQIGIGLYSHEQQKFYLKVARILARHFMENILPFLIQHSKRMFEAKRIQHLKIRRLLLLVLENLDC